MNPDEPRQEAETIDGVPVADYLADVVAETEEAEEAERLRRIRELIDSEVRAAEEAEDAPDMPLPSHVKVTRGHDPSKVLQVRLNEDEFRIVNKLAEERGVPTSTFVRALILKTTEHKEE